MTDTIDHAALQRAIAKAAEAEASAHRALADASPDAWSAALIDYVRASTRRSTLNEAGLIITLGPLEETDDDIQP